MTQVSARRRFVSGGIAAAILTWSDWPVLLGDEKAAFQFKGTEFYFRWTDGRLFEFTRSGQENLSTYSDMVSILVYQDVRTPDELAAKANATLQSYKNHKGRLVKTFSVPATLEKPAEYFLAVILGEEGVVEGTFARFVLVGGAGYAVLYAHRVYGPVWQDNSEALVKWEDANGAAVEKALMKFASIPSVDRLEEWGKAASAR